ncbi:MAG: gluconokinase [Acidobacteriota bacterium]
MHQNKPPYVLAIDVGTSSVRVIAYDHYGSSVTGIEARAQYQFAITADGAVEIDPERLFNIVAECIDSVLALLGERSKELLAVATTTFWHSLVGIDKQGRALTPLINWNDTRSRGEAARLRNQVSEVDLHARTGCRLHASYWPAKLGWLADTRSQLMTQVRYWLSFGDYLFSRLFGEILSSLSMASGTGLLNQHSCDWDDMTLAFLPIDASQLPTIVDINSPCIGLRNEFATRWPALADIPWYPPLGDGACSNIGCGCTDPSRFALMIGTSGALRAVAARENFVIPSGLWCYRIDRRRIVMGGALANGGNLFAWMRDSLQLPSLEEFEKALTEIAPDSHGLTLLPLFSGERSPGWRDDATAALIGLRLATQPVEILRAGLEAVAYQFALIYKRLADYFDPPSEVIATGGALRRSSVWRDIIADVLGMGLRLSAEPEASSRGAALLVLEANGLLSDLALASAGFVQNHLPNAENHKIYQQACTRQQALYRTLIVDDWQR